MKTRHALFLVPLLFTATACAVADTPTSATSAPASVNPSDAQVEFARCMRENGVEMSDPKAGGGMGIDPNVPKDKLQRAMKACERWMRAGTGQIDPDDPKVRDAMVRFTGCMRENGFDMPDPPTGDDLLTQPMPGDPDDPAFKRAMAACRALLPGGGQG
jgi:hypothetical protein